MTIIEQILALEGPMPDAAAHARYLATLTGAELQARAAALVEEQRQAPQVEFWRGEKPVAFNRSPLQTA